MAAIPVLWWGWAVALRPPPQRGGRRRKKKKGRDPSGSPGRRGRGDGTETWAGFGSGEVRASSERGWGARGGVLVLAGGNAGFQRGGSPAAFGAERKRGGGGGCWLIF